MFENIIPGGENKVNDALTLNNMKFIELDLNELMEVDGGGLAFAIFAGIISAVAVVAVIGLAPAPLKPWATTKIICGAVALTGAAYCL